MRFERIVVWLGGGMFVASLAVVAWWLLFASGRPAPFGGWQPIAVDAMLFVLFAGHHSALARARVQAVIRQVVPQRLLRTLYVWTASILLVLVCWLWQPVGGQVFHTTGLPTLVHSAVVLAGLILIVLSVRAIDALELAGIRQSHASLTLQITGPYRFVRHPLYLGWILIVFAPANMTGDRFTFAVISSAYLLVAVLWEERSLEATFGDAYAHYRQQVRSRVIPYVY